MSLNVSAPGIAFSGAAAAHSTGGAASARGEWNGLKVSVANDPMSMIANAAEELTFAASEKVEKQLSKRKKPVEERRQPQIQPPPETLEKMQQAMGDKLQKLLQQVKAGNGSPAQFEAALAGFTEPGERHTAMIWLEDQLSDQPSLSALATKERKRLEAEQGAEVRADYNIHGVDAEDVGGAKEGGALYRRTILGHAGVAPMLEAILQREGDGDVLDAVDFLRRAVGADLSAASPSTDKRELDSMNSDLFHLRAIGNFTREFSNDLAALRKAAKKPELPRAGVEVLRLLFKAKDQKLPDLAPLRQQLRLEEARDPTYDVRALTRTHTLAHSLPERLFTDQDSRQRLLGATQKLLDAAVDREEELGG